MLMSWQWVCRKSLGRGSVRDPFSGLHWCRVIVITATHSLRHPAVTWSHIRLSGPLWFIFLSKGCQHHQVFFLLDMSGSKWLIMDNELKKQCYKLYIFSILLFLYFYAASYCTKILPVAEEVVVLQHSKATECSERKHRFLRRHFFFFFICFSS